MLTPEPIALNFQDVALEPLTRAHASDLKVAAGDGDLWDLWYTAVPFPGDIDAYIEAALDGQRQRVMLPWVVRRSDTGEVIGATRYHDIVAEIGRVEIGYTWYARRFHRTAVNTCCKIALLKHAFDTLGCSVAGFRTDGFNFVSQRAIERLGAKRDGVLRRHQARRDGTIRDNVMYSILAEEWPDVRRHLLLRLSRHEQDDALAPAAGASDERSLQG